MVKPRELGLSFLDVLCSAMGATIVLAVVFAIVKNPVRVPLEGEYIVVELECRSSDPNTTVANRDLGLVVRTPVGQVVAVTTAVSDQALSASVGPDGRVECWQGTGDNATQLFVQITDPVGGTWELRPYLVDWRHRDVNPVSLARFDVWLRSGPVKVNASLEKDISEGRITLENASDLVEKPREVVIGTAEQ